MSEQKIPISARLYNAAVNGHVAGTEDIVDDTSGKTQKTINSETDNKIQNLESTVGEGGNIDERIATEGAKHYLKSETYTKEEVHNLITTPSQEYVTVTATDQTTDVTDVLPATGSADTVYRVGNWDGTQYDTTCYTEYSWNGSAYIKLNTKEYGVDDEPTAGSKNVVESGGTALRIGEIAGIETTVQTFLVESGVYYNSFGERKLNNGMSYAIIKAKNITLGDSTTTGVINTLDSSKSFSRNINNWENLGGDYTLNEGEEYFCISYENIESPITCIIHGEIESIRNELQDIDNTIEDYPVIKNTVYRGIMCNKDIVCKYIKELFISVNGSTIPQFFVRWLGFFHDTNDNNVYKAEIGFTIEDDPSLNAGTIKIPISETYENGVDKDTVFVGTFSHSGYSYTIYVVFNIHDFIEENGEIDFYYNVTSAHYTDSVNKFNMNYILNREYSYIIQQFIDNNKESDENIEFLEQLNYNSGSSDRFNLLFFSDAHAGGHPNNQLIMNNILAWGNKYGSYLNDVLHGGDIVADNISPNDYSSWDSSPYIDKMLQVIGNHDVLTKEGGQYIETEDAEETYDRFFAPYISNWGVVYTPDVCYYYKDYTGCGIRLIVTDCMHYDDAQKNWFVHTLADAKSQGLHVIVANHWNKKIDKIECNMSSLIYSYAGLGTYAAEVQNFIDNGGLFICWLAGHTHFDEFGFLEEYPNQLAFNTVNSGVHDMTDTYRNANEYPLGMFNVVSVNVDYGIITIWRVGIQKDEFLRSKKVLVYDYTNKKIHNQY